MLCRAAEESSSDFKRQLDALNSSSSESDLASKLSSLQASVDQYNSLFASVSADQSLPDGPTVSSLLESQKSQIESLTLELSAANESTNALCEEVDKLSAAYGEMERVSSGKVMDLSAMEDKVLRLTTEVSEDIEGLDLLNRCFEERTLTIKSFHSSPSFIAEIES